MYYIYITYIYIYIYIHIQKLSEDCYRPKAWRATRQRCCNNCVENRFYRGVCGHIKQRKPSLNENGNNNLKFVISNLDK